MKRLFSIFVCSLLAACVSFDGSNPYKKEMRILHARAVYPEGYEAYCREGVTVTIEERNSKSKYSVKTDARGEVSCELPNGLYMLAVYDKAEQSLQFNGTIEQIHLLDKNAEVEVEMHLAKPGTIVIKEIYTGGCPMTPAAGYYVYDKYLILHNNDMGTQYLDGLCMGMVDPYNSKGQAGNYWNELDDKGNTVFREYACVPDCVWQFPGEGADFPLAPGEDAVVALNGAVDHTATYPLSVNLNRKGYFVCYDETFYPDTRSHPVPGDQIEDSHYLKVLKKTGLASSKAYVVSNFSPAVILYRAPEEVDMTAYLGDDTESLITRGSLAYTKIPWSWIIDGVEVFDATGSSNAKRLRPDVDVGAVVFSGVSMGHTLHRRLDEVSSTAAGYEIYQVTRNSTEDFYEREIQSLHE